MRVEATPAASEVIEEMRALRGDDLVVTIGTGCCESTAPFLYDRYMPDPGSKEVGEVAGVRIFAPGWLAEKYETLVLDAERGVVTETFSIEAEIDARLCLLAPGQVCQT